MSIIASIIITNHNYGKYIGKCIRSCINQSYDSTKYEIIIIDDASTDKSDKVIFDGQITFVLVHKQEDWKLAGWISSGNSDIPLGK